MDEKKPRKLTIRRTFTPSYDADSREAYELRVRTGAGILACKKALAESDGDLDKAVDWLRAKGITSAAKAGRKRLEHVQVASGRIALRREQTGAMSTGTMSEKSARRLASQQPPWDRRTQSAGTPVTEKTAHRDLAQRIARSLDRYRSTQPRGDLGLWVPDTAGVLMAAGMPANAANQLVKRAHGKFIAASAPNNEETLMGAFVGAIGFPRIDPDTSDLEKNLAIYVPKRGRLQRIILDAGEANGMHRRISLLDETTMRASRRAWLAKARKASEGVKFAGQTDADDAWIAQIFATVDARARQAMAQYDVETCSIKALFAVKGVAQPAVTFPFGSTPIARDLLPIGYRNLKNVDLDALPEVLARLSRPKRRGRSLPPFASARENPMSIDEQFWFEQYDNAPHGARGVARPNMAGKRKMHGIKVPSAKKLDPELQKLGKAVLEGYIANGYRVSACKAVLAWRKKAKAAAGKVAQPATRKTKKSRKAQATKVRAANRAPKKVDGRKQAAAAMKLFHSGKAASLADAWVIVKGKARANGARRNYDETMVRQALVPTPFPWAPDPTQVVTALENRRRRSKGKGSARKNSGLDSAGALWLDYWDPNYEQAVGQFGVSEGWTSGIQPMSRRNSAPKRNKKGQFVKQSRKR